MEPLISEALALIVILAGEAKIAPSAGLVMLTDGAGMRLPLTPIAAKAHPELAESVQDIDEASASVLLPPPCTGNIPIGAAIRFARSVWLAFTVAVFGP